MENNIINKINGCGTALVTPFTADGNVDYTAYRNLIRRQIDAGIHFLAPLVTTSETPCLIEREKVEILRITKDEVARSGRVVPIVVGAGGNCTAQVVESVRFWSENGADACLVVTPYYNKPTQEGMYLHFSAVADTVDAPIILYNVPSRTGANLTAETTLRLAEKKNIIAIKEASSNYDQINTIINNAPKGFKVFSGNDNETLNLMCTGAAGVISVASNVAPAQMVELVEDVQKGDLEGARNMHKHLSDLFKNCFVESNPIPCKAALSAMGLIDNVLRLPLTSATERTMQIMKATIDAL